MEQRTYKVCPQFSQPCKLLRVEFLTHNGIEIPCEEAGCITVALQDGATNHCVEFYVFCEDCATCPPERKKICFCHSDEECDNCEYCGSLGICVSKCKPGQICDGDKCEDCDEDRDCPGNQICKDGNCVCPQGTFWNGERCIECDENTHVGPCEVCVDYVVVPKPCGGVCDPATGDCTDCLNSGDCIGREDGKHCCEDKICKCCPGFKWDAQQKICVVDPCTDDDECGTCEICTKDGCAPVVCPDNYKCVDDECVYWPCQSTTCSNGADCGPDCGCVEGVGCVPCYLLSCLGLECSNALGCACVGPVGNQTCKGVDEEDNCIQNCDSFNPCDNPLCTCYESDCVSCRNFPCVSGDQGCDSFDNCGCTGAGDCEGGKGCNDSFTLIKEEDCSSEEGCKLKVEFQTEGCICDPIKATTKILNLTASKFDISVDLFKSLLSGDYAYANYKNELAIGDNEMVNGSVEVRIIHYTRHPVTGQLTEQLTTSKTVSVANNSIPLIPMVFGTDILKTIFTLPTVVDIFISAKALTIPNNSCIAYGNTNLASIKLDFRTEVNENNSLNNLSAIHTSSVVNDNVSTKRPMFIWMKSTTGDFSGKFDNTSSQYNKKGWFRKVYASVDGDKWVDEIRVPSKTANGELFPNYNYKIITDCGCKVNEVFHEALKFCCPGDYTYELTNCNKKIVVQPFDVCQVNGKLASYNTSDYKIPGEVRTNYKIELSFSDGTKETKDIVFSTNTRTAQFIHEETDKRITGAVIYQSYSSGILSNFECPVYLDVPEAAIPEHNVTGECDDVNFNAIVTQTVGSTPRVTKVEIGYRTTGEVDVFPSSLTAHNNQVVGSTVLTVTRTIPKNILLDNTPIVKITYGNACVETVVLAKCEVEVLADSTLDTSNCPSISVPKQKGSIITTTNGFSLIQPIVFKVYLSGSTTALTSKNSIIGQSGTTFLNINEGDYRVTAEQNDLFAETLVTVEKAMVPEVYWSSNLSKNVEACAGHTDSIVINAVPGSRFSITRNGSLLESNIVIPTTGIYSRVVTTDGQYIVKLVSSEAGYCQPYEDVLNLVNLSETISPKLVIEPSGTVCSANVSEVTFKVVALENEAYVNENIVFRLTPVISGVSSSNTIDLHLGKVITLPALETGATYSGNVVLLSKPECASVLTVDTSALLDVVETPAFNTISVNCNKVTEKYTIRATFTNIESVQSVAIGSSEFTPMGSEFVLSEYSTSVGSTLTVSASNGDCVSTQTVNIPSCDCETMPAVTITGLNLAMCNSFGGDSVMSVTVPAEFKTGAYEFIWLRNDVIVTGSGGLIPTSATTITHETSLSGNYKVRFINKDATTCTYDSNQLIVSRLATPLFVEPTLLENTIGSSTYTSGSSYIFRTRLQLSSLIESSKVETIWQYKLTTASEFTTVGTVNGYTTVPNQANQRYVTANSSVLFAIGGSYNIRAIVRNKHSVDTICESVYDWTIAVASNCPTITWGGTSPANVNPTEGLCGNLLFFVNSTVNYEWRISQSSYPNTTTNWTTATPGQGNVLNFATLGIPNNTTVNATIQFRVSADCPVTSQNIIFKTAACLCSQGNSGNSTASRVVSRSNTSTGDSITYLGLFEAGSSLNFGFNPGDGVSNIEFFQVNSSNEIIGSAIYNLAGSGWVANKSTPTANCSPCIGSSLSGATLLGDIVIDEAPGSPYVLNGNNIFLAGKNTTVNGCGLQPMLFSGQPVVLIGGFTVGSKMRVGARITSNCAESGAGNSFAVVSCEALVVNCDDTLCGSVCVDLDTNNQNCGACGVVCGLNQKCCNGVCTNITTTSNCGSCGNACAPGQTCSNGNCTNQVQPTLSMTSANTCSNIVTINVGGTQGIPTNLHILNSSDTGVLPNGVHTVTGGVVNLNISTLEYGDTLTFTAILQSQDPMNQPILPTEGAFQYTKCECCVGDTNNTCIGTTNGPCCFGSKISPRYTYGSSSQCVDKCDIDRINSFTNSTGYMYFSIIVPSHFAPGDVTLGANSYIANHSSLGSADVVTNLVFSNLGFLDALSTSVKNEVLSSAGSGTGDISLYQNGAFDGKKVVVFKSTTVLPEIFAPGSNCHPSYSTQVYPMYKGDSFNACGAHHQSVNQLPNLTTCSHPTSDYNCCGGELKFKYSPNNCITCGTVCEGICSQEHNLCYEANSSMDVAAYTTKQFIGIGTAKSYTLAIHYATAFSSIQVKVWAGTNVIFDTGYVMNTTESDILIPSGCTADYYLADHIGQTIPVNQGSMTVIGAADAEFNFTLASCQELYIQVISKSSPCTVDPASVVMSIEQ